MQEEKVKIKQDTLTFYVEQCLVKGHRVYQDHRQDKNLYCEHCGMELFSLDNVWIINGLMMYGLDPNGGMSISLLLSDQEKNSLENGYVTIHASHSLDDLGNNNDDNLIFLVPGKWEDTITIQNFTHFIQRLMQKNSIVVPIYSFFYMYLPFDNIQFTIVKFKPQPLKKSIEYGIICDTVSEITVNAHDEFKNF